VDNFLSEFDSESSYDNRFTDLIREIPLLDRLPLNEQSAILQEESSRSK
jgi:hypothetical protein